MPRWAGTILLACAAGLVAHACALKDWSGLDLDGQRRIVAVNNRPGAFAYCEPQEDRLACTPLPFAMTRYSRYDFEGIAFVRDDLFYAVSEKRDNQCMVDCRLKQDVTAFRFDEKGRVALAVCGSITIPLLRGDNPNCPFANCGLEGIAYDSKRSVLYVSKESDAPRIFSLPLGEDFCPTGVIQPLTPPEAMPSYNDLAYSRARDSLFILSTRAARLYEWRLSDRRIGMTSAEIPELHEFLNTVATVEAVAVDDATGRLLLAAESGRFLAVPLPPPRGRPQMGVTGDEGSTAGVGRSEWR